MRIVSRYHPMTEEYQTARLLFDIVTRLAFPVATLTCCPSSFGHSVHHDYDEALPGSG